MRFAAAFGGTVLVLGALAFASCGAGAGQADDDDEGIPVPSPSATPAPVPTDALPDDGVPTGSVAAPDGPETRVTDAPTHAQEADVGACYLLGTLDPTWGMANVAFVDCTEPHHGELVRRYTLSEPTPIDVGLRPADDAVAPAVDFAVEACVMTVWGGSASDIPVGPALYFPTNLVHEGVATEVVCARESTQLHAGSVARS